MLSSIMLMKLLLLCSMLLRSYAVKGSSSLSGGVNPSLGNLPPSSSSTEQDREQLYEAYNLLHSLAQDFHKPFDAPAVIVVGHQTSGKSALIEALMGFQFNQVLTY